MITIYDIFSNRFFGADVDELCAKEKEFNKRKEKEVTYNDVMRELFGADSIGAGYWRTYSMPIEVELTPWLSEPGVVKYYLIGIRGKGKKAQQ